MNFAERNVSPKLLEINKERYIRCIPCNSRLVNIPGGFCNRCVNCTTKLTFLFQCFLTFPAVTNR